MPYLSPSLVLGRFSGFARDEVRPAIGGEDDEFMQAQVGSMSSTLSFLSKELDGMGEAVDAQHDALLDALDGAEHALADADRETDEVEAAVEDARERVRDAPCGDVYEHERVLVESCSDVLEAVDERLDGETARAVREPLYRYLRTRVQSQLEMLGRDER